MSSRYFAAPVLVQVNVAVAERRVSVAGAVSVAAV
jgi:hypothetical protein